MSRSRRAAPASDPARPPRICHERVVPATRMAVAAAKRWAPGTTLRCRFLDGTAPMRKKVRDAARTWMRHANVRFAWVQAGDAEIRISFFADTGSWSALGRDALDTRTFPADGPTMNFGWVRDDSDPREDRAVVLHEFGHALGCVHEHQSPTFDRTWDEAAVRRYFRGPPNRWNAAEIRANVLEKHARRGTLATAFDPKSIMLYWFDAALFSDGLGPTNENTRLSRRDIAQIRAMYPPAPPR